MILSIVKKSLPLELRHFFLLVSSILLAFLTLSDVTPEYRETVSRISDRAADFYELVDLKEDSFSPSILFQEFLRSLPEVCVSFFLLDL